MPPVQRFLDPNSAGGVILSIPQGSVFANFKPVAVLGSTGSSHPPCDEPPIHCAGAWVTTASTNVFVQGVPVTKSGDVDTCGHPRVDGSPNVFING